MPDNHCGARHCRTLFAYWFGGREVVGGQPHRLKHASGSSMTWLYETAEFLKRMANPQTVRDLQFSKRYAHQRSAQRRNVGNK